MSNPATDRGSWIGSIRTRVAVLAFLVLVLLVGCGIAFVSVLGNRMSAIVEETKSRLSASTQAMARDYARDFPAQSQPSLDNPDMQAADDALFALTTAVLRNERGTAGGFFS